MTDDRRTDEQIEAMKHLDGKFQTFAEGLTLEAIDLGLSFSDVAEIILTALIRQARTDMPRALIRQGFLETVDALLDERDGMAPTFPTPN